VAGIRVSIHWSWFLVAVYEIQTRRGDYSSPVWNVAEYLALFGMVLLHEFGHAFACRMTGGQADEIILWPLGGVAFVRPPERPGALLWSIAAGPLVNALLVPFLALLSWRRRMQALTSGSWFIPSPSSIWCSLSSISCPFTRSTGTDPQGVALVSDRSREKSHGGLRDRNPGAIALGIVAWMKAGIWLGIVAAFILIRSLEGFRQARLLPGTESPPRHRELHCPSCGQSPPCADLWACDACGRKFDTFETGACCPGCGKRFGWTSCPLCGTVHPSDAFR